MEASKSENGRSSKRRYSLTLQILTSLFALLYLVFFLFSFVPSPEGSPIADHPYTPWDTEMILVKLLFVLFMIGFYFSWKDRLTSGIIYLLWCLAVYGDAVYIGRLLHVSGDSVITAVPIFFLAMAQIIAGLLERKRMHAVSNSMS